MWMEKSLHTFRVNGNDVVHQMLKKHTQTHSDRATAEARNFNRAAPTSSCAKVFILDAKKIVGYFSDGRRVVFGAT